MRKLKVKDIKPAVKLVNALNVGEKIKEISAKTTDVEKAGIEIIGAIMTAYASNDKAEKLFADFLSGVFEMDAKEILELDIDELIDRVKQIGGLKAFTGFFGNVL